MSSFYSSTFIVLLCFIGTVNSAPLSKEFSSSADNDIISDSDGKYAIQFGNDVKLISRGPVELILTYNTLVVDVDIKSCIGKVLFCYDSSKTSNDAREPCGSFDGFCGFQLIGTEDKIQFTKNEFLKDDLEDCTPIEMKYPSTKYCGVGPVRSCNPKIDQDGRTKIEIVNSECPVTIKNAKIYVPPTSTSSTTSSLDSDSASNAGLQWYYWILIVFGVLLIVFCGVCIW
uniref:Uncharacterized protein n=1 Tax=Panagrolaimus superbus TaxID=310955 RepID=A0A914Y3Q2_9BILA